MVPQRCTSQHAGSRLRRSALAAGASVSKSTGHLRHGTQLGRRTWLFLRAGAECPPLTRTRARASQKHRQFRDTRSHLARIASILETPPPPELVRKVPVLAPRGGGVLGRLLWRLKGLVAKQHTPPAGRSSSSSDDEDDDDDPEGADRGGRESVALIRGSRAATRSGRSKTTALKDRRTRSVVRIAPAGAGRLLDAWPGPPTVEDRHRDISIAVRPERVHVRGRLSHFSSTVLLNSPIVLNGNPFSSA